MPVIKCNTYALNTLKVLLIYYAMYGIMMITEKGSFERNRVNIKLMHNAVLIISV
jgi:hypothetical protein